MMKFKGVIIGILVVAVFTVFASAYVVDEREQVVVTQFGKVVGKPVVNPGLKFKIPFVQKANYFPKNLQSWDGDPGEVPTKDKVYIWVDIFAMWKIVDPVKYFQTVNNMTTALGRLDDIIGPSMRNLVTSYRIVESVRNSNRPMDTFEALEKLAGQKVFSQYGIKVGRTKITRLMMAQAQPELKKFGIELEDIEIKRINYVEKVRRAVYKRMIAERNQIAEKYRSEGKGEANDIRGDKEKELQLIKSMAYKTSQEIKGKADGKATAIYADAYGVDPEFYSFSRTLELYKNSLDKTNTLVISTHSDFMKYLKSIK